VSGIVFCRYLGLRALWCRNSRWWPHDLPREVLFHPVSIEVEHIDRGVSVFSTIWREPLPRATPRQHTSQWFDFYRVDYVEYGISPTSSWSSLWSCLRKETPCYRVV